MKKLISLLLSALLIATAFCGCATNPEPTQTVEKTPIRVAGMKGPTSIGMVGIMEDNSQGVAKNDYSFSIEGSADAITPKLIKGLMSRRFPLISRRFFITTPTGK